MVIPAPTMRVVELPGSIAPEIHRLGIATAAVKIIIMVKFFIFEIFHVIKNIISWQRHANGNQSCILSLAIPTAVGLSPRCSFNLHELDLFVIAQQVENTSLGWQK
jgi:hypothetical protein